MYCGSEHSSQYQQYGSPLKDVDFNNSMFISTWPYVFVLFICSYDPTVIEVLFDLETRLKTMLQEKKDEIEEINQEKKNAEPLDDDALANEEHFKSLIEKGKFDAEFVEDEEPTISYEEEELDDEEVENNDVQVSLEREIDLALYDREGKKLEFADEPWREYKFYE